MNLERSLVLNRYFHILFGAERFDELRRIAFFMATGSGKTLLLHVNILQLLHYLKTGRHPEALVRRPDGRTEFDNILLITPGEGLSDQHLAELSDSGLHAGRFDRSASIHDLTPRPKGAKKNLSADPTKSGG